MATLMVCMWHVNGGVLAGDSLTPDKREEISLLGDNSAALSYVKKFFFLWF